jgi:hypothetical protein
MTVTDNEGCVPVRFPIDYNDSIFDSEHNDYNDYIPLVTISNANTTSTNNTNIANITNNTNIAIITNDDDDLDKSSDEESLDDDGEDVILFDDDDEENGIGAYLPRTSKSRSHVVSEGINPADFKPKITRVEVRWVLSLLLILT